MVLRYRHPFDGFGASSGSGGLHVPCNVGRMVLWHVHAVGEDCFGPRFNWKISVLRVSWGVVVELEKEKEGRNERRCMRQYIVHVPHILEAGDEQKWDRRCLPLRRDETRERE